MTSAGIISAAFILFFTGIASTPKNIWITGLATTLAIGISGLWGAFLSEDAERKKKMIDLKKDMVILDDECEEEDCEEDIEKAMVAPIEINGDVRKKT